MRRLPLTVLAVLVVIGAIGVGVIAASRRVPAVTDDFISYWSSSRLLLNGDGPYSLSSLLSVQRSAGWPRSTAQPIWYGPWVLFALTPVGVLPYWVARLVWLLLQVACVQVSAVQLWKLHGGSAEHRPTFFTWTYAPTILCLLEGQITPLILLGFVAFVLSTEGRHDWRAGAALFPASAKPATLYLVWLAIGVWVLRSRRFRVSGACALLVAAGAVGAWSLNARVFSQWVSFTSTVSPLTQMHTTTLGSVLRLLFGEGNVWLAYLGMVVGVVWWVRRGNTAQTPWRGDLSTLTFVSLLTAPYAWSHDALLLLPAVLERTANRRQSAARVGLWLVLNGVAVWLFPALRFRQTWYLIYLVALLAWTTPRGMVRSERGAERGCEL